MNVRTKKRIWKGLAALAVIYIAAGAILYLYQDRLLFHPRALPRDHRFAFDQPFEELNMDFEGNNLSIVKFKPSVAKKGIVLFYHGNMKNVEHYKKYPAFFLRNGWEVWMLDYPGFGKTGGKRSEALIYRQALKMYSLARKETAPDSLIIYGKSIGTGIAAYVASIQAVKKLILETPYYGITSLARHYAPFYPVGLMNRYSFPTHSYLEQVKAPITAFHGTDDEIIPLRQAKALKKEHPNMELTIIKDGRHNNLSVFPGFQKKLDSLLSN